MGKALQAYVDSLPEQPRAVVREHLYNLIAHAGRTGHAEPLIQYMRGLQVHARLERSPGFRESMKVDPEPTEPRDLGTVIDNLRERRKLRAG